jgi:DNA (cytosine-5)-methyltransferase 1
MEEAGYACTAVDICAAGIGAPHIRQRLYWVANRDGERLPQRREPDGGEAQPKQQAPRRANAGGRGETVELGNNNNKGLAVGSLSDDGGRVIRVEGSAFGETEPVRGFWSGADWVSCRDGKWRPVEQGTFPLAAGSPDRVGCLRAYGNAIVAPLAAEFIKAYLEC